jgi:hypothetical protein
MEPLNKEVQIQTQKSAFKDINRARSGHKPKFFIRLKANVPGYQTLKRIDLPKMSSWCYYKNFSYNNEIYINHDKKYLAVEHSDGEHYIIYQQKIAVPKEFFVNQGSPEYNRQLIESTDF